MTTSLVCVVLEKEYNEMTLFDRSNQMLLVSWVFSFGHQFNSRALENKIQGSKYRVSIIIETETPDEKLCTESIPTSTLGHRKCTMQPFSAYYINVYEYGGVDFQ